MARTDSWKRNELALAKRLGGKRVPITGRRGADVAHEHLCIEAKERKTLPQWILHALDQAQMCAKRTQLPIAILHQLNSRHDDDVVCVRLKDWEQWYGSVRGEEE